MTIQVVGFGSTVTTTSELPAISEINIDDTAYWGAMVFIPAAFTTNDKMELRFYAWNIALNQFEKLYYQEITGGTSYLETGIYIPPTLTNRYRLTFKRTAGVDRAWSWQIYRQSG